MCRFSLVIFSILITMYFDVAFFVFILLGGSGVILICEFIRSGKYVAIISSNVFPCFPALPGTLGACVTDHLMLSFRARCAALFQPLLACLQVHVSFLW